jgi:hypothetical protein
MTLLQRLSLLTCLVVTALVSSLSFSSIVASKVQAQSMAPTPIPALLDDELTASEAAAATLSAELATPAATIQQEFEEQKQKDITDTGSQQKSKLAAYLEANPIGSLSWHNFLQYSIRDAINRGLPANIVVLILLFPVIASIISFSRHVIGMKGFGIYTPAVLSVAFVSTGIANGILLFLVVLIATSLTRKLVKQLNLHYLPRTAMLFWGVSVVMLGALIVATYLPFKFILGVSIFPLLIIILLSENFSESQLSSSQSAAVRLTLETLVTAILCSLLIASETIQRIVILQPELTLLVVAGFNILIGRYTGLRLLEWMRFKSIIDE